MPSQQILIQVDFDGVLIRVEFLIDLLCVLEPVTCVVSDHTYSEGIKNCTWSSCREGMLAGSDLF